MSRISGVIALSIGSALVGRPPAVRGACAGHRRATASRIAFTTAVHRVLEAVAVGRDDPGVIGRSQRRHRPVAIEARRAAAAPIRIAAASALPGSRPRSSGPAAGPLLDRGVEEELEVRVGQHDRPDVAAGHDDPAGRGAIRAAGRAARPAARARPRPRDGRIDRRAADLARCGRPRRRGRATGGPRASAASSTSSTSALSATGSSTSTPRCSASHVTAR